MGNSSAETESRPAQETTFEHMDRDSYGYHPKQVDEFFASAGQRDPETAGLTSRDVRETTFDAVRGGYLPAAVDAALDRLEDALAARERDELVRREGEDAWLGQIGQLSRVLRDRLHRPDGERFRRPRKRNVRSYATRDVDELCESLLEYFEQDKPMSVDTVRRAVFHPEKGRNGYEEHQVDGFFDRVIELMAAID